MKLDRADPSRGGVGKYAVLNLRKVDCLGQTDKVNAQLAMITLHEIGVLNYGLVGSEHEFFVLMLKDIHAEPALRAYANSAGKFRDMEYAVDVDRLADRAGGNHPLHKLPD